MHWQEIVALAIVAATAALFVRGFFRRSPAACGRDCACPAVTAPHADATPEGAQGKVFQKRAS